MEALANDVTTRLAAARAALLANMHALGLTAANGWRIVEELRHTVEGTEWVIRPMHIREVAPHDLRSSILIDHDGRPVSPG